MLPEKEDASSVEEDDEQRKKTHQFFIFFYCLKVKQPNRVGYGHLDPCANKVNTCQYSIEKNKKN